MSDEGLRGFLAFVLGEQDEGYLCIASRNARTGNFNESFFAYPKDVNDAMQFVRRMQLTCNIYFCPTLLSQPKRVKESVRQSWVIWADADTCPPEQFRVPPTLVVETSTGRTQVYWRLTEPIHATDAEDINRRIAYAHASQGCDKSGWDLTQLLRIPTTKNHKYADKGTLHNVRLMDIKPERKYETTVFDVYPTVEGFAKSEVPFPELLADQTGEEILQRVRMSVNPRAWKLFQELPEEDWSKNLWQLQLLLFEVGLSREEVFLVARDAACNKYKRDGKSEQMLWKEVIRAEQHFKSGGIKAPPVRNDDTVLMVEAGPLLSDEERAWCEANPCIVEEYIEWGKTLGDAAWQYHQAGAFVILSTLLAGQVRLPTSYGIVLPNLWFMILADTTLTRKTTAMDMAVEMLLEVDSDCVLATDGSIEGLLTSLSMRPGRPSIFLRDEFSGLLEMMTKRDYYAGMLETLTKLYDGKFQKRVLRRETLEVRDPVLVFFAGGIKERVLSSLSYEHVNSGFLPRFCFITAESDVTRLKPLGPPTAKTMDTKHELETKLRQIWNHYNATEEASNGRLMMPKVWNAELTDEAWVRYNRFEADMVEAGLESNQPDLMTPTFDRLCKSGLKASVLLSAAHTLESKVVVHEHDIVRAFYYVEQWRDFALEVVENIGKTTSERHLERLYEAIKRQPGVSRSRLMQNFHLTAREAEAAFLTLEQRGQIIRTRSGRGESFSPVHV